jgi:uncharacterized protein (TIGR03067 family)
MNSQCSIGLLKSSLAGTLAAADETWLHRHLEECEECSAALEQMAGGPAWCQEAASLLTGDELDSAVPTCDQWSEADFTVEHLEPADEPNVLGRLGGYDVLEIIGRGGMGVVLKGFERELKRCVAIKVLAPHLAQSSLARKRFTREAQAAAAIVHPNVMAIHQVLPNGRLPFLVMPLLAGESLAERLAAQGVLELKEILRIGMQAAAGLAAAHEQGLVHRDVKPANLLLEKGVERAMLTDFGLACAADDVSLTRYGIIAGTPQYMSPEQAQGEAVDGRSDLFSLGCVLYEMASGVSPFRADSTMATLRRLIDEPPQALVSLNPELPPWFVAIVDRLLEKDPSRRFSSAKEVSELLEGCLAHVQQPTNVPLPAGVPVVKPIAPAARPAPRWSKRRRFGTIAAVLLLLLGGFAAFLALTDEPSDISGEWTGEGEGEGWGRVVLRRTGPTEYAGTYTDTIGKEPGKIELKWSRIERRYNGAWSEGADRFGKLSVRLVGGEIRGAWTTSRDSRINPGTPELADLLWVRARAAAQKKDTPSGIGNKPPEVTWAYGPVINQSLYCPGSGQHNGNALRLEDNRVFDLQTKSASGKGDMSPEELAKWYDETKVNLVFDYRGETDQWELKLRNVRFADLPSVLSGPRDDWPKISANELQERFAKLEWRKTTNADTDPKWKGFQSLLLTRGDKRGMTFAFETSDGHRGILLFNGGAIYKSPTGAMRGHWASIRYKLLQPANAPAKPEGDGIGKKPPEAMDGNKDLESLVGTWNIDTMGWGDDSLPKELMKGYKFVFAGNKLTWEAAVGMTTKAGGKITANDGAFPCDFKIDPSKKPKEIDITLHLKQGDRTYLGIYEIKGDALKVYYYVRETGRRPTEFSSKDEPRIGFITLTRAKKEQPAPSKDETKDAEGSKTPTAEEPVKAPRADEADAVKLVEKLGGKITRDDKQPGKPVVEVNLSLKNVTDADLKALKELKQLTSLNLYGCRGVTNAGVKELKEFKQLTSLSLMRTQVTEAGVKELKDCKQLTKLILGHNQMTDAGLKDLKELKQLTELRLIGTPMTNAGLKELKDFKQLTILDISGCKAVTDVGLKELKDLKQLTDLDLTNTKVTDLGVKELKELMQLTRLMLSDTQVTDAGLKDLKGLKQLTALYLGSCKVTDTGLKDLKELKQLTTLGLRFTQVTDAGVKELQEALPECKVRR